MACCSADDLAELAALRADYAAVRLAIRAILGGSQMYQLDTSQTRLMVTRASLGQLQALRAALQTDIAELEARCSDGGGGGTYGQPSW